MAPKFIGRQAELSELRRYLKKKSASLLVVKGRRRIGKSRLIEEFAKPYPFYEFSGLAPTEKTTKQSQLDEFASQLGLRLGLPGITANDWNSLFFLLAKHVSQGRAIILFDEISWMGTMDPDFLGKLKNAWDLYFKKNAQLILFICGSSSAWIEKNILSSTAFMGRVSYTLTLDELTLPECNHFWSNTGSRLSNYDKFKLLSVIGGIPRYLEEIQPQYSAEENIQQLCFQKGGLLTHEFKDIFSDLFGKRSQKYVEVIRLLVQGSLEYGEICKKLNIGKSGLITEYLNDLVTSGFISRDYSWHPKKGLIAPLLSKYRLRDNYLRFYLKYMENRLPEINKQRGSFQSFSGLPGFLTIMGLQFENLVLNNRRYIHQCLRLSAHDIVIENPYFQRPKLRQQGCQIDYMIQTRTRILYVCEIKFSQHPIKKDIIPEVQSKLDKLTIPRGFSVCPVLIHVNGAHETLVDSDYFTEIIDFGAALTE